MSWLRFWLLGDFGQQLDLSEQREQTDAQHWENEKQNKQIQDLSERLSETEALLGGLASVLKVKGVVTVAEFEQSVENVVRERHAEKVRRGQSVL